MLRVSTTILVGFCLVFLNNACLNNAEHKSETGSAQETGTDQEIPGNAIDQVIDRYLKVKDALVATDAEKVKAEAEELTAFLKGKAMDDVFQSSQKMSQSNSVKEAREHFETLSEKVYNLAQNNDAALTLYKQFCPMAFNNKGAFWLSAKKEIRNPYFGDKMLKCGVVQETL